MLSPSPDNLARGLLALGGVDFGAAPIDSGEQGRIVFAAIGLDRHSAVSRVTTTFHNGFAELLASSREVKEVAEWYPLLRADEPVEVWLGADASKDRLMAMRVPPRVLHLATYSFYHPDQSRAPMLASGIALAGANRELASTGTDGILFAVEAEGLDLLAPNWWCFQPAIRHLAVLTIRTASSAWRGHSAPPAHSRSRGGRPCPLRAGRRRAVANGRGRWFLKNRTRY